MKWVREVPDRTEWFEERSWFALFPVRIGRETRWLERVSVWRRHWYGPMTGHWWVDNVRFTDAAPPALGGEG